MFGLLIKELRYNVTSALFSVIAIALPIALIMVALTLFTSYDQATEREFASREKDIGDQMKHLHEQYRKITLELGFNILILPKGQDLSDFYADDFAVSDMPFEYARRLSDSKIVVVNHLLPALFRKIEWKEKKRTILLTGIQGEVPLLHRSNSRKPMMEVVEPGHIIIGYELSRELSIKKGATLTLNGETFTVAKCNEQRGTVDDITVWIDFDKAQTMLGMNGKISAMFALECRCNSMEDRVGFEQIRTEIQGVLPETQVIEFMSEALSRAEARWKVVTLEKENLEQHKKFRSSFIAEKKRVALGVIAVLAFAGMFLCGWLVVKNVDDRKGEIALFSAIGVGRSPIKIIFLARTAILLSGGLLLGAILGCAVAVVARLVFGVLLPITTTTAVLTVSVAALHLLLFALLSLLIGRTVSTDAATGLSSR